MILSVHNAQTFAHQMKCKALQTKGVIVTQQDYETAKAYYQQGDWSKAASTLTAAMRPGEYDGPAHHLLGNSLMKLGMYHDAAVAYSDALQDEEYGKKGALACNRARAYAAAGEYAQAEQSALEALQDPDYPTPYKAYMALGNAYFNLHKYQEAGVAFRNAAMDETNTDPARSLVELGHCFVEMGRALDAVEAYRTALDFAGPMMPQHKIYADMGRAYVAANKMQEACDSFVAATEDGVYTLTPSEAASYEAARRAVAASKGRASETDQFLAQAGYSSIGQIEDPLDPLGKSGELIPSADDTGFFTISEEDLVKQDKAKKKKKKGGAGRVFTTILIIVIIVLGVAWFAYYKGYGWPSQSTVVTEMFAAKKSNNTDLGEYMVGEVDQAKRKQIASVIPQGAQVEVKGVDRSMKQSRVYITATLPQGGKQNYIVDLNRSGLSWKVSNVLPEFPSQDNATTLPTQQAPVQAPKTNGENK